MRFSLIQLSPFDRKWRAARLKDEDLQALEQLIMRRPDAGDVIRSAGGLRKIRFAPPSWHRGKSGALRVCYAIYEEFGLIILVTFFGKNEQANLTDAERNQAKVVLERITAGLRKELRI
jgi:mRNA-degrading endonuclease RelE of RelBE toxin-antitoxin system